MEMTLHAPMLNWLVPYMPYLLGLQGAVGCSGPWVVWCVVWCGVGFSRWSVVARCSCISGARAPKGRRECKKQRTASQPIRLRKLTHPVPCCVYLPCRSCVRLRWWCLVMGDCMGHQQRPFKPFLGPLPYINHDSDNASFVTAQLPTDPNIRP